MTVAAPFETLLVQVDTRPWDRHFRTSAAFCIAVLAITIPVWLIDDRLLNGVSVWSKPIKFQLSLALHFATLAFVATRLSAPWRRGLWMTILSLSAVASLGFELGYIMLQAARQEASHFYVSTEFHAAMYSLMGVGATLLVAAAAGVGVTVARDPLVRLGPGARSGVIVGFIGGAVATLILAGYMSGNGGHFVGAQVSDAGGLPLTGWSTQVGDLRPAHFLSLHAMQILPIVGWGLDRFAPANARGGVLTVAGLYLVVMIAVFFQALAGMPLVSLG